MSATASVPTNAWAIRATGSRRSGSARATPKTSYTPARKNVYPGGRNAVGRLKENP
jgi:hypothetical protein